MTTTVYVAYALTGGAPTALDYIDGTTLADGDVAFVYAGGIAYQYVLDDDSAADESPPDIIAPDAHGGDKRWVLQNTSFMAAGGVYYQVAVENGVLALTEV